MDAAHLVTNIERRRTAKYCQQQLWGQNVGCRLVFRHMTVASQLRDLPLSIKLNLLPGFALRVGAAINFTPCPELNAAIAANFSPAAALPTFDCATLPVPLDYTDDSSPSLDLSLFRINATQQPVLGSVLMNFGGPGGTAPDNLAVLAEKAHSVIGPEWNLISWDPRGTGFTIPFQCDVSELGSTATPSNSKRSLGELVNVNITDIFSNGGWDYAGQNADLCYAQANKTGSLIGTAFVARDMMHIVDALGEDGLLRYYGWSYGTALGAYVVAMFPDRIGRIVLDANVNPHTYQDGTYITTTADLKPDFDGFLQTCFEAKDDCALYTLLQPNTTEDFITALNEALAPLAKNATESIQGYLTYIGLKATIQQNLYFPSGWPKFAQTLAAVFTGSSPAPKPAVQYGVAENAVVGIRASDATFHANSSDEYLPTLRAQQAVSPSFSDAMYVSFWVSAQWKMPAKERYWGDFHVKTKTPVLFINGQHDPVTPLENAYNASASFEGSAVLSHSGYGHGLFASPSQCAADYVQAYFKNATLPPNGTHCEPDLTLLQMWVQSLPAGVATNGTTNGTANATTGNGNGSQSSSTPVPYANDAPGHGATGSFLYMVVMLGLMLQMLA
ncbi:hypothetical protein LTR78_002361 [Recurvomyces mirabilis]|uniref:Peptidase S33 tripeptidyl aminopeptidase-like C-terminal domain-containing protein n=1 Tax=Recurvomyces mirabilis TaxID=574656 RepID=A0AAE0WSX7_9PEZI|nr:hypothetical protein LTR78_002361 [Recurvomyces mirabilis]KAK5157290.1 hypothetical protein LTS14_004055 [Recurvomyces mirabilis]